MPSVRLPDSTCGVSSHDAQQELKSPGHLAGLCTSGSPGTSFPSLLPSPSCLLPATLLPLALEHACSLPGACLVVAPPGDLKDSPSTFLQHWLPHHLHAITFPLLPSLTFGAFFSTYNTACFEYISKLNLFTRFQR